MLFNQEQIALLTWLICFSLLLMTVVERDGLMLLSSIPELHLLLDFLPRRSQIIFNSCYFTGSSMIDHILWSLRIFGIIFHYFLCGFRQFTPHDWAKSIFQLLSIYIYVDNYPEEHYLLPNVLIYLGIFEVFEMSF